MALKYNKESVKQKIDCCFADTIYNLYLNKRFGVNFCKKPDEDKIQNLNLLKNTYDYFYNSDYNCFSESETDTEGCNIEAIIEKINII
jgi:hypothetical protein